MEYIAHVRKEDNGFGIQTMDDHLNGTACFASEFASKFQNEQWGHLLGIWHDIGKYSEAFQSYIKVNSGYEEDDQKHPKTDHTSAGAILSKELYPQFWPSIAYCIAGHHAGLHNWYPEIGISGDLTDRLKKQDFLENIRSSIPSNLLHIQSLNAPIGKPINKENIHLWIRMLFSCLIDADRLDTERFMNPEAYNKRGNYEQLASLKRLFDNHMQELAKNAKPTDVNRIRGEILRQCINSGKRQPGFFSITVPTGGGKTLSSMAWALEHAVKYNKSRIIIAIPYTSIITQTVQVYRNIFGEENVVEHHSNIDEDTTSQERKLAVENWDAPIVVTTNVQLFESLFSNKTSRCRKLHNMVNSIIILDEAQMLPPEFLKPILTALKNLVGDYNVSVLLSTATQPALTGKIGGNGQHAFMGIEQNTVWELISDTSKLTEDLKRVELQMPDSTNQPVEWEGLSNELSQYEQLLCIVNTRRDCRELYRLMPAGTIHLSRMMCTAHIMDLIAIIKQTLKEDKPIRVISTQLIEAGVDVDFPVVYRALTGLDSVAQSAGRCNREGKLNSQGKLGLTKVFCSPNGTPPGLMRKGADTLQEMLVKPNTDFFAPETFKNYFSLFYSKINNFDKPKVFDLLEKDACEMKFQFATAARNFQLIDDKGTTSILVEYKEGAELIGMLRRKGPEAWLMRKLQRYSVSVNERDFVEIQKAGLIDQIHGCWVQSYEKLYSKEAGLMSNGEWLEEIHII
jgi:CRISPR-associated endonuclease/helicase Cas3